MLLHDNECLIWRNLYEFLLKIIVFHLMLRFGVGNAGKTIKLIQTLIVSSLDGLVLETQSEKCQKMKITKKNFQNFSKIFSSNHQSDLRIAVGAPKSCENLQKSANFFFDFGLK